MTLALTLALALALTARAGECVTLALTLALALALTARAGECARRGSTPFADPSPNPNPNPSPNPSPSHHPSPSPNLSPSPSPSPNLHTLRVRVEGVVREHLTPRLLLGGMGGGSAAACLRSLISARLVLAWCSLGARLVFA